MDRPVWLFYLVVLIAVQYSASSEMNHAKSAAVRITSNIVISNVSRHRNPKVQIAKDFNIIRSENAIGSGSGENSIAWWGDAIAGFRVCSGFLALLVDRILVNVGSHIASSVPEYGTGRNLDSRRFAVIDEMHIPKKRLSLLEFRVGWLYPHIRTLIFYEVAPHRIETVLRGPHERMGLLDTSLQTRNLANSSFGLIFSSNGQVVSVRTAFL